MPSLNLPKLNCFEPKMNDTPPPTETLQWTIEGPMGIYNAAELTQQLHVQLEQGSGDLVVHLAAVDDLDSAGVQLLALARRECLRLGRALLLESPSEAVVEVLTLYNLIDGFEMRVVSPTATEHEVIHE